MLLGRTITSKSIVSWASPSSAKSEKGSGQSPIEPVSPVHCTVCTNQIQVRLSHDNQNMLRIFIITRDTRSQLFRAEKRTK